MTFADIVSVSRERCFTVAEVGIAHNGSPEIARALIDEAARAGFDSVKLQKRSTVPGVCYTPEKWAEPRDPGTSYGATFGEHRIALEFDVAEHMRLADYAHERGLAYGLSVWDIPSLADAVAIGVDFVKLGSATTFSVEMVTAAAHTDLPLMISTGMHDEAGVSRVVTAAAETATWLGVFECTSAYPTADADIGLGVLAVWCARKREPLRPSWLDHVDALGLSDHSAGIKFGPAAVCVGARIVEKHITLDRAGKGSDHAAALEPDGMRRYVRDIRAIEAALRNTEKRPRASEERDMRRIRGGLRYGGMP